MYIYIYICINIHIYAHVNICIHMYIERLYMYFHISAYSKIGSSFFLVDIFYTLLFQCYVLYRLYMFVDVYVYLTTFTTLHVLALMPTCVFKCVYDMHANSSVYLIFAYMCLVMYVRCIHTARLAFVCVNTCTCMPMRSKARQRDPGTHVLLPLVA